jgi:hypothetical protein
VFLLLLFIVFDQAPSALVVLLLALSHSDTLNNTDINQVQLTCIYPFGIKTTSSLKFSKAAFFALSNIQQR